MRALFDAIHAQRRGVLLLLAVVAALAVVSLRRMPASILPEVTFPRVKVIADSGELPSDVVLRDVTRPLEESIRRVPGILEIRSTTSRGSAEINLDSEWGSDLDRTVQRVQSQVDAIRTRLPAGTTVDVRLMNPTLFPVVGLSLTSDQASLAELRDFADMVLRPELSRLPGVAEVVIQGGRTLEARVTLDPVALVSRGLDAAAVVDAVRKASALESAGLLEANGQLYLALVDGRPRDLASLESLLIPASSGAPVRLGQLGKVSLEEAPEFHRYRANSREAVLVNLLRQPSASSITLSVAAHRWFEENRSRLPRGTQVQTFYDQSDLVRASVGSVRDSLVVGALLAVLVIMIVLKSRRLGLAGAAVLPASIAMTLIGLSLSGQSLNMMTLGGIAAAVGLVLDDGIVVVEHLAARSTGEHPATRSQAMAEIFPVLVGSSLCSLAIFLPFVLLGGVTGAFFRVLTLSMALMLGSSLLLCLTLVPLTAPRSHPTHAGPRRGSAPFTKALERATERRWIGVAAALAFVLLAIPLYLSLGSGFLPEMDEGSLILDYIAPPGTSLQETDRLLQEVEEEIAAMPEILTWSRRTGDQLGFFVTEPNIGDYALRLRAKHRRGAEEIADDLRGRIEKTQPALAVEFGQLVEDVIGDLTTTPQPIEIRIFDENRRIAEDKAREVAAVLGHVRGVVDVKDGVVVSGPNVTIAPRPAASRVGESAEDLALEVTPAIGGTEAGSIARGARAWPIRFVMPRPSGLSGAEVISRIPIPVGTAAVRTGEVAAVQTAPGETEIGRDNLRTMVAPTARLSGRDLGSAMAEIQRQVRAHVALPPEARIQYAGMWAEQQSSFRGLAGVLLGALALVTAILLFSFRSWRMSLAVLLVVFSSLLGVFLALHLGRASFNISSFVGAIMMVGIVSENAYFLVAAHRDALRRGRTAVEAAREASMRRARPVLMTTFAGVAALAPLALGVGAGSALLRPLAIAVVGGFVTSAFLLLLVLPSLLAGFGGGLEETQG